MSQVALETIKLNSENDNNSIINYLPTVKAICRKTLSLWQPPLVLLMLGLSLVSVFVGYQFHPTIEIKLGGGYDTPFLNLQEQESFGGVVQLSTPQSQQPQDITDNSNNSNQSSNTNWRADKSNAWQPTDTSTNFPLPEPTQQNYRWALQRPIVLLPGMGSYPSKLTLELAGSPIFTSQHLVMLLNGGYFTEFDLKPGPPTFKIFELKPGNFKDGNLAVELRVTNIGKANAAIQIPAESDKPDVYGANVGFKFYSVKLEGDATGVSLPPLSQLILLVVSMLLLYFICRYLGLANWFAVGLVTLSLVIVAILLATYRLELTDYTSRLTILLLLSALFLPLLEFSLTRLCFHWQLPLPQKTWNILLVIFAVGFLLRGGGVIYPQTVIVDGSVHLVEIEKILHGQILAEYLNKQLSVVPGQWNSSNLIPYSTIPYFLLAPFGLAGNPEIGVNLINAWLDAIRIFIIFGLAIKLGTGIRAATIAAGLYLLVPATWLLNSWGNWPTTLSLWLAVLYLFLYLVYYPRLENKKVFVSLTLFLTLTFATYVVTAVFVGTLLLIYCLASFFFIPKENYNRNLARRSALLTVAILITASVLAVALYYWQFVGDTIVTITNFGQQLGQGSSLGLPPRSLGYYYGLYTDHIFNIYGVGAVLTIGLAFYAFSLVAPKKLLPVSNISNSDNFGVNWNMVRSFPIFWFVASWLLVFIFFGFVGWKVDMVDKQVWFVIPLALVLAGAGISCLWRNWSQPILNYAARVIVVGCILWLTYSSLSLWIYRLAFKRH